MNLENESRWYAVTVRHQHERPVESGLRTKGFEVLAPFYESRRQWSDRVKQVESPLFPGYLFCRMDPGRMGQVLSTPGARKIVSFGRPMPVPEEEIAAIQALVASGLPVSPWPYLKPGDGVWIEHGPFRGLRGTLLRESGGLRVVVGVEMLQRSIAVELAPDVIVPLRVKMSALATQTHTAAEVHSAAFAR